MVGVPLNRNLVALGLAVTVSLTLLELPEPTRFAVAERCRAGLLATCQWVFTGVVRYARSERRTRFLLTQNVELALDNMRLREEAWENLRLRRALQFRRHQRTTEVIPAEVIGRDPDQISDIVVVNVGSEQGVEADWPVVTAEGLVGHVTQVGLQSSVVQLLMRTQVSALIQETRAQGIVAWVHGNVFELRFVEATADIQPGDTVVSSGLGGRYPKGIPIGRVFEVRPRARQPLFLDVFFQSRVDFRRLEEVFLMRPSPGKVADVGR